MFAEQAALNNAIWCDTVCRAHGRPGQFLPGLWVNRQAAPRFYPNVVTLTAGDAPLQMEHIRALSRAGLPAGWAVKDSFRALDLAALGFEALFDAEWIWRPAEAGAPDLAHAGAPWAQIWTEAELAAWETAAGSRADDARMFPPVLLADPALAFLADDPASAIRTGGIINRAAGAAGLSNLFGPPGEATRAFASAVAAAQAVFPGLPLVGYESGDDLAAAQAVGFAASGPLRVWVSSA